MRKLIILILVLAVAAAVGINTLYRKAPAMFVRSIEGALDKTVSIGSIEYHFPGRFELGDFAIKEKEPFLDEVSFEAKHIRLDVSLPALFQKKLVLEEMQVEGAGIAIRKYRGKLYHALRPSPRPESPGGPDSAPDPPKPNGSRSMRHLELRNSHFQFIDYDVQPGGFVIFFDAINADIRDISFPFRKEKTMYRVGARMLQSRDEKPATLELDGWTYFDTRDTDAHWALQGIHLPYFHPYYSQVSSSWVEEGYLDSKANIRIQNRELEAAVQLEIQNLLFGGYEEGGQLFGLTAENILSFLRDSSGKLKFQFVLRYNLADRSQKLKDILRKSIESSLKQTVFGSVGNILQNTIQKIGTQGFDQTKDELEDAFKKVKTLFSS